jgi:hypothetical protein
VQGVGAGGEQHRAADADAPLDERDAAVGERSGERALEPLAALLLGLALARLGVEPVGQVELPDQRRRQHQHEGAQHPGHQVAEGRPGRAGEALALVRLIHGPPPAGLAGRRAPASVRPGTAR